MPWFAKRPVGSCRRPMRTTRTDSTKDLADGDSRRGRASLEGPAASADEARRRVDATRTAARRIIPNTFRDGFRSLPADQEEGPPVPLGCGRDTRDGGTFPISVTDGRTCARFPAWCGRGVVPSRNADRVPCDRRVSSPVLFVYMNQDESGWFDRAIPVSRRSREFCPGVGGILRAIFPSTATLTCSPSIRLCAPCRVCRSRRPRSPIANGSPWCSRAPRCLPTFRGRVGTCRRGGRAPG